MRTINRVFLAGRLGAKPEIKQTKNGKSYVRLSLATSKWKRKEDGQFEEQTDWHKVMVWGNEAERCAERLDKGSPIFVQGELNHYKLEEDGRTRYLSSVTAQDISFMALPLQTLPAS